jgi:feruloyl esterase
MAGLPHGCASSLETASGCQQGSVSKTPAQWGDLVRAASTHTGPWPRVQIWQGTNDYTVAPANATELVKQWTNVWGADQTADETQVINTATRTRFTAGSAVAVELYLIDGMGHAIATGDDPLGPCPATTGAFFANKMICSTRHTAAVFGLLGDDAPPPSTGGDAGTEPPGEPGGGGGGCNAGGSAGLLIGLLALLLRATSRR